MTARTHRAGVAAAPTPGQGAGPVLRVDRATKRFGSVLALDGIDLSVHRGQILCLLGDNGAGKSTLIKCISGVHRLDGGTISLDGVPCPMRTPSEAQMAGIETVYQDLALFDNLSPSQNFYAGRELSGPAWLPRGLRFLHKRAMETEARELLDRLQVTLPGADSLVAMMSGGQRQAIAVARAMVFSRKVVILDEPTAALGLRETRQVLDLVARLRDQGNAVILITHNMDHVTELGDRAVVLRQGRKVGELIPDRTNRQEIVSMIVGA